MRISTVCVALGAAVFTLAASAAAPGLANPFADNNGMQPTRLQYKGPMFKLSHAYPSGLPAPAMPWRAAIKNGVITTQNAGAYAQALKQAVARDMRVLLFDYANWNADKRGWYNEPWLGQPSGGPGHFSGREAIHGTYVGAGSLDTSLFAKSGLTRPMTTYVLTYYDKTAAQTLRKVWNTSARKPALTPASTQYAEGSLIVKAAFVTAGPDVWPVMTGAQVWPLYISTNATIGEPKDPKKPGPPKVTNTYLMQFDIIVKDSVSAPDTGWVFSTLVYDPNIKPGANGIWDQMVVLGAQWGNDPQANSTTDPSAPLLQNWNNPAAPMYGGETFGWGERLSGPNDGAMNDIAYKVDGMQQKVKNAKDSSCMSCHSSAQWNVKANDMPSFLLPLTTRSPEPVDGYLNSPAPGSADWLRWFQNRKGDVPMDKGSIATDFDMVLAFKSLPYWFAAQSGKTHPLSSVDRTGRGVGGAPSAQK